MLVTFHSKAWSSITLFGEVALTLLKMAGHSGTVPSALRAGDVAPALARLKLSLAAVAEPERVASARDRAEDADAPPPVGLRLRAFPLIELLSAADQQKCDVTWETGAPLL
jgi:hypothetical protein